MLDEPLSDEIAALIRPALDRIRSGDVTLTPSAKMAYRSFLGYYVERYRNRRTKEGRRPGRRSRPPPSREEIVRQANAFAKYLRLGSVPELPKNVAKKMGLTGVLGVVVADE